MWRPARPNIAFFAAPRVTRAGDLSSDGDLSPCRQLAITVLLLQRTAHHAAVHEGCVLNKLRGVVSSHL